MSRRSVPPPGKLVISAIFRDEAVLSTLLVFLSKAVGEVKFAGPLLPFDFTDYYSAEMSKPLFRRFFVAPDHISRDTLPEIKIRMEEIETELSEEGKRTVNLDPGLLTPENFVLATGKNFSHRIYLKDGVFADLTLVFQKGEYNPLPWTYPDYASLEIRTLLKELRGGLIPRSAQ
ncbi:MAG: DUF4416 family protein [Syntrophorhabdaceae bacterium]|nr:DUF4416 family protein [Syntrophorhabdaceae bacterium]